MDTSTSDTSWNSLPWKKFQLKLFHLQSRIYRAMQANNLKQTIKLQNLLLNSRSVHFMAVKSVTSKKNIKKFNYKSSITDKDKMQFALQVTNYLLRIDYKQDSTLHFNLHKTTSIEDQIVRSMWKYALVPIYKIYSITNSYHSKVEQNLWTIRDTVAFEFNKLLKRRDIHTFLRFDVTGCFNHQVKAQVFVKYLILPLRYKMGVIKAIQMGLLHKRVLNTIHDDLLPFILVTIVLRGIDTIHSLDDKQNAIFYSTFIIYALKKEDSETILTKKINRFLHERGLCKSCNRSKFFNEFELLNWNFKLGVKNKIVTYPSKMSWVSYKTQIKSTLKCNRYPVTIRLAQAKKISSTWFNYHCHCNVPKMKSNISSLRLWCNKYLRKNTKIEGLEIRYQLKKIFSKY